MAEDSKKDELTEKVEAAKKEDQANQEEQKKADTGDQQIEELKNQLARAMADLQNFRRRTEEEKAGFVKYANAQFLKEFLPVIDNFNRSMAHVPEDLKENDWTRGVIQIHRELSGTLEKLGIQKIETVGKKLDPKLHEGLMTGPGEKDVITEELEPGYTLHGEPVKPAKVKVGDGSK